MRFWVFGVFASTALSVSTASAGTLTVNRTLGTLDATAVFEVVNTNQLQITLSNTSLSDALVPSDILTAVVFDVAGSPTLGTVSALMGAGSTVFYGTAPGDGNIGGEWAYKQQSGGLSGSSGGYSQAYGISSTGLGIFGPGDLFGGPDLDPPISPDGLQWGLTSAGDVEATGNGGLMNNAVIKNSAVFTLSGLPNGFDPMTDISNVGFQYGTDLNEPFLPLQIIPTPPAIGFGLAGLLLVGLVRRRGR